MKPKIPANLSKNLHRILLVSRDNQLVFEVKTYPVEKYTPKMVVAQELDPSDNLPFREHRVKLDQLDCIRENVDFVSLELVRYRCYTTEAYKIPQLKQLMVNSFTGLLNRRDESLQQMKQAVNHLGKELSEHTS